MEEVKFIKAGSGEDTKVEASCCASEAGDSSVEVTPEKESCSAGEKGSPLWITGSIKTPAGIVSKVSTEWSRSDYVEHIQCRISAFRMTYTVNPGLYAVGDPDGDSDIFVSANYKLSFDMLRRGLHGINAWVLVLDTKGINVWCAAGKGTFGTRELITRIDEAGLAVLVNHRKVILPQLGAPGISAHTVKKATGFRVHFGPVCARDIKAYVAAGYEATGEMRSVRFPLIDRLVLTPMEIIPSMKRFPLFALTALIVFGLQPSGILFGDAIYGAAPFLLLGLISIISGALITPLFLPFLPFRSFAVKGWIAGLILISLIINYSSLIGNADIPLLIFSYLFFPAASSYIALQFTGSTTFTGLSGVKKELKIAVPLYISAALVSFGLLIFYKIEEWGLL